MRTVAVNAAGFALQVVAISFEGLGDARYYLVARDGTLTGKPDPEFW
jgi:hypothetical protein